MPLTLKRGRVSAIVERHEGLVRLEVDGTPCVAFPDLTGAVALGDDVIVNVQARELGLGSGGFDILHVNLTRGLELPAQSGAHVMKLPYTPLQFAAPHAEEQGELPATLAGRPVVACSLHSQVAPVCAALRGLTVAYVQLCGGALPVALSDSVRELKARGLVQLTVAVGPCFGGDVDCVNVYSGLAAAAREAEVIVCGIGPGIVGTGSRLGHGGLAAAVAISAADDLGGDPILTLRISDRDRRDRHRGVSHHTEAILSLCPSVRFAWPAEAGREQPGAAGAAVVDAAGWRNECAGLRLSHMGRGPDDDPSFFAAAFAAGVLARALATGDESVRTRHARGTDT